MTAFKWTPFFIAAVMATTLPIFGQEAPDVEPQVEFVEEVPLEIGDGTDAALAGITEQGLTRRSTLKVREDRDVTLVLSVTDAAQKIMDAKEFDMADAEFDQKEFETFLTQKFGDGLAFLLDRVADWPGKEVHLVISDLGEDRKLSSAFTIRGSRVIEVDVRRWQKALRLGDAFLSETTPVHELTHVLQGFADQREEKYHRELAANIVEVAFLRRRVGTGDPLFARYLELSGPSPLAEHVLDSQNTDSIVSRHIAHKLVSNMLNGTYKFEPKIKKTENPLIKPQDAARYQAKIAQSNLVAGLEKFAISYASHAEVGDTGFDAVAREAKLLDAEGEPLTLDTLRRDVARDLASAELVAQEELAAEKLAAEGEAALPE